MTARGPGKRDEGSELPITGGAPASAEVDDRAHPVQRGTRAWRGYAAAGFVILGLLGSLLVGLTVKPTWSVQQTALDVVREEGVLKAVHRGTKQPLGAVVPMEKSPLRPEAIEEMNQTGNVPADLPSEQVVVTRETVDGKAQARFYRLNASRHFQIWSLLPPVLAIGLCLITKEPLTALLAGVVSGALIITQYDITGQVLIPGLARTEAATILVLYLWLLGGLMGVWARTGAARAFADLMTRHFVRGPRSAKFVGWMLGVLFFQGGTMSTVLVGTAVRPIGDARRVSHEEMSYVVDSTASPIASVLAFNAWPAYVAALTFVPGIAFLATERDRIAFFFECVPLSFYSIFAVTGTLLLCFDKLPLVGRGLRYAAERARATGALDAPGSTPMSSKELETTNVPAQYRPHSLDFFLPLFLLVGVAVGSFMLWGSPEVHWAFGAALLLASLMALARGMSLGELMEGIGQGLKGVVYASVILMLAIIIGGLTRDVGGGRFLVDQLGSWLPYWLLPAALVTLTVIIAFSTGTSFGTYAVAFPLAMPLAWSIAEHQGLDHPKFYLMICFASVLNGSVFGDQCSPISDTTILSSMTTGADLMDHVRTQLVPASVAMTLAVGCWTTLALVAA